MVAYMDMGRKETKQGHNSITFESIIHMFRTATMLYF